MPSASKPMCMQDQGRNYQYHEEHGEDVACHSPSIVRRLNAQYRKDHEIGKDESHDPGERNVPHRTDEGEERGNRAHYSLNGVS